MAQLPKCSRKGCKTRVNRASAKYCSALCGQLDSRSSALAAAARRIDGAESKEDVLARENLDLRNSLKKTQNIVDQFEKQASFEDRVLDEIKDYIVKTPYAPVLKAPAAKKAGTSSDHEMLALLSDAHFPEVVDPKACMGVEYNADICRRRMTHWRDTVIRYRDLRATSYPVRKLTIAVNGDMLSGNIHEELEITNEMPMSEALVEMSYMLFDIGKSCRDVFPEVEMIIMPGNHPRMTQKPRAKDKWNNFEYIMGKFVQGLAKGVFDVVVPKDLIYRHKIFNQTIGVTHGDGAKVQSFAGIPFYGMERRQNKLQGMLKAIQQQQLDMLCYGHFHQLIFQQGMSCSLVVNGSIKGPDEYAMATMYAGEAAVQALLTFHAKHGLTDLSRISFEGV